VFSDLNGNGAVDAGDTIVRQSAALAVAVDAAAPQPNATFTAMGTNPTGAFTINVCHPGFYGIDVRVRRTGHTSTEKTAALCP
jgi:hypothetical protein